MLYSTFDFDARWGCVVDTNRPPYPGKETRYKSIGGWVGTRSGLDGCGKSRPPPPLGFDPGTVQPVACHCTDYTNPDQSKYYTQTSYSDFHGRYVKVALYRGFTTFL